MLRTILVTIGLVACVPPQQQQQGGGYEAQPQPGYQGQAAEQQSVATEGPEHANACDAACKNFDGCGKQPYSACVRECAGMAAHKLERFAMFTCEELTAVLTGTVGTQCMSYGKDDCRPLGYNYTCCGGNEAMRTPGRCLDMAVCAMPRY